MTLLDTPVEDWRDKKMLSLSSKAFADGNPIPVRFTGDSSDISPPLEWKGEPPGTQSFALICDDPDAPKSWVHWVIFNIPSKIHALPERIPPENYLQDGSIQGINDFHHVGYEGPAPPGGTHHYYFKLYALDTELHLRPGITREQLLQAMKGHVLEKTQLMCTYSR